MQLLRWLLIGFLTFSLTFSIAAQQPLTKEPVKIRTSEVLLDILVRDKKGRPINDLRAEEIEIFEDGVKQTMTKFTAIGKPIDNKKTAGPAEQEAVDTGGESQPAPLNLVTLLFDHLPAVRVQPVRDAALNFLDNSITDNMQVRVMVIGKRLYLIEQFTKDKARLRKAIVTATGTVEKTFIENSDRLAAELRPVAEQSSSDDSASLLARVSLDTLTGSEKLSREVKTNHHIFPLLPFSRAQRQVPGRKIALYFSDGLYMPPGFTEMMQTAISEANLSNVSFYSINIRNLLVGAGNMSSRIETATVVNQTRRPETAGFNAGLADSFSVSDRYQGRSQITTNFNTFEVIDRNKELNKRGPLADLTEGTGGFQFTNSNDLNGTLKRVAEELGHYYAASYLPSRQEYDGKFRSITVKVSRPGAKVQSRAGYFALPPSNNKRPVIAFETPLLAALNGPVVPHDFPFRSTTLHFESRQNETHCETLIEIPLAQFIHDQDPQKKAYPVKFAAMGLVKDEKGEVVQSFSEPHEMEIPAGMIEDARKSSFTMTRHFWLPAGHYTIESSAHDQQSGQLSAERKVLDVLPTTSPLQTGSLFLIRQVEQIDPQANADAENPLILGDRRILPDLLEKIVPADRKELSFHLAIYPDRSSAEKPLLKLELLLDGKVIATTTPALPAPDANGRISFMAGFNTAGFSPGEYRFHAVVRQGTHAAEESTVFSIAGERTKPAEPDEKTVASALAEVDKDTAELTLNALKTIRPLELSPDDLIAEVEKTGARLYTALGDYTYSLRKVRRVLNPAGKIKSEDYQDFEAYPIRGKHALIQLAENGSRLSNTLIDLNRRHATDTLIKTDEEMRKLNETQEGDLNRKIGYWGASLEGRYQKRGQPQRMVFLTIDPEAFFRSAAFSSPRSVLLEGRETIVLDFQPRPGVKYDDDKAWIGTLRGTVWVDAADRALVRIEGQDVAGHQKQESSGEPVLNFVYQQQRLANAVWGPSLIRINSGGNENLFQGLNWDAWFQFTNFKRFDTKDSDVKIVSPEAKGNQ